MKAENIISYNSREYSDFMVNYRSNTNRKNQILVYAGEYATDRTYAINELKRDAAGETNEIDLATVITLAEQECYTNIDEMVENINPAAGLIIFRNGDILNGAYTGFTASAVKYGTPQEKYFLKKIKEIPTTLLLELKSTEQLDRRLINTADKIVLFPTPSSILERFFWNLKNVHIHGSRFLSPRKT